MYMMSTTLNNIIFHKTLLWGKCIMSYSVLCCLSFQDSVDIVVVGEERDHFFLLSFTRYYEVSIQRGLILVRRVGCVFLLPHSLDEY